MAVTIEQVYERLNAWAPFETQMDFDNAGLLVGRQNQPVSRILTALDITKEVILEAAGQGCQLIVSHHPVIFHPVKSMTDGDPVGEKLLLLAEHRIGAICAHTNLDAAQGGVNECLARTLGLSAVEQLHQDGVDSQGRPYGIGRVGLAHESGLTAKEYAAYVKERLGAASVRFADGGKPVHKVAVGGGSCGSMLLDALEKGCDTFITADVKYDQYLEARALRLTLMDAGHFPTEQVVVPPLAQFLAQAFPELEVSVSAVHGEVYEGV